MIAHTNAILRETQPHFRSVDFQAVVCGWIAQIGDLEQFPAFERGLVGNDARNYIPGCFVNVVRRCFAQNAGANKVIHEKLVGPTVAVGQPFEGIWQAVNRMNRGNAVVRAIVRADFVHIAFNARCGLAAGELGVERFAFCPVFGQPDRAGGIVFKAALRAEHGHSHRARMPDAAKFIDAGDAAIREFEQGGFIAEGIAPLV